MILKIIRFALNRIVRIVLIFQKHACKEILVLGDSHALIFSNRSFRMAFPYYYFNVVSVGGATISGLENPNSKTQALPIFMDNLKTSTAETIIILLGEVDTGFVIWYRSEKYGVSVSEMMDNALRNYQDFLLLLSKEHQVICVSTPLPTIKDGQDWGEIANARRGVETSQIDRTKLTLRFNNHMKEFCRINKIGYLNFDNESIGEAGVVSSKLLNKNPNDHHYEPRAYINMIIPKLKKCIEQGTSI